MKEYTLNKYQLLGIILIGLIWESFHRIIGNSVILPSPIETLISFKELISNAHFINILFTTLSRIIISFLIGLFIAIIIGIMAALNSWFYNLISPIMSLFKTVPTMAIVILALIWLTNKKAPILIAILMVLPILYEAVIKGIKDIDPNLLSMANIYQVKPLLKIKDIYIPSVLHNIGAIFSSTIGLCLKLVIGGEVLGQPPYSIGTSIQTEKMYLNTAGVLAWILILVILSFIIDKMSKILLLAIYATRRGSHNGSTLR